MNNNNSSYHEHLKEIIDFQPDAMFLIDRQTRIRLANYQAELMFGYPAECLSNQTMEILLPERFREAHRNHLANFFVNPTSRPMGNRLNLFALRRDGNEFPADIAVSPLKTSNGQLLVCVVRDVSERKQVELALRESEQNYRALFEYANDAIFLLDLDGAHVQVNQKAADLLGYTREDLVGMRVQDTVVPQEYPNAQNKLEDLLQGRTLPLYERNFRGKDGTIIPVEINVSLIRDDDGKPILIQSIVRDIRERKKTERELLNLVEEIRQSHEELRSLSARMEQIREEERRLLAIELHDQVGQTLTGLSMNLQIIRHQIPKETAPAVFQRIEDSEELLKETTTLVRNVMADLRPPMLDDYGLLSALNWYCQNFSQRTGIAVHLHGEELQPRLPAQVEIVLFRIVQEGLNNIAKYAHTNQADILLEHTPGLARLIIADEGAGFEMNQILSPHQKPHWGLLNMQERAASIGGRLSIQSAPGQGTRISLEFDREGATG